MNSKQMDAFLKKLSARIAELRRKNGMTQEKLAEEAEIDRVALANIETGRRNPTVMTVYKIARALDLRVEDIFKGL
jgi:DNA-binding XRE family transcriptional regulator